MSKLRSTWVNMTKIDASCMNCESMKKLCEGSKGSQRLSAFPKKKVEYDMYLQQFVWKLAIIN